MSSLLDDALPDDALLDDALPDGSLAGDLERAAAVLAAAGDVVLACHVAPDGDALGSLLGLGTALRRRGTRVVATWGEPELVVPDAFAFLPGQDLLVPPAQVPAVPEVLVVLDSSSPDRLGVLADRLGTAGRVLVVDHHTAGRPFGDVRLVDPSAAATAVLVVALLDRLGLPLDADVATALYTGLVTDTGSFRHASTTPRVHALAGRLLDAGVRPDLVARSVFDTRPFAALRALGTACASAELEPGAVGGLGLVWTALTSAQLASAGAGPGDVEGVIDVVRTTGEAEVAAVLVQQPSGALKASLRSKGAVDVGAVCGALGGGGHRFAAGLTTELPLPQAVAQLRDALAGAPHLPT